MAKKAGSAGRRVIYSGSGRAAPDLAAGATPHCAMRSASRSIEADIGAILPWYITTAASAKAAISAGSGSATPPAVAKRDGQPGTHQHGDQAARQQTADHLGGRVVAQQHARCSDRRGEAEAAEVGRGPRGSRAAVVAQGERGRIHAAGEHRVSADHREMQCGDFHAPHDMRDPAGGDERRVDPDAARPERRGAQRMRRADPPRDQRRERDGEIGVAEVGQISDLSVTACPVFAGGGQTAIFPPLRSFTCGLQQWRLLQDRRRRILRQQERRSLPRGMRQRQGAL